MTEPTSKSAYSPEFEHELVQSLGRIFETLRKEAGVSVSELSQRSGVAAQLIESFEQGEQDVEIEALTKLLDGIKSSFVDLFNNFDNSEEAV